MFELERFSNNVALIDSDGTCITYKDIERLINQFAKRLTNGKGLLLLEADNSLNTMIAYIASIKARCPIALIESSNEKVNRLKNSFTFLYHYNSNNDSLLIESSPCDNSLDPDLAMLLSTSGSTGASKCVCLSYDNLKTNAQAIIEYLQIDENDRAPTNLPFYYSYGMSVINSHLLAGGSIVLTKLSVMDEPFWELFDRFKCTSFAGVPHTYEMLDKLPFKTKDRHSLRYSTQAGGKLSRPLVAKYSELSQNEGWQFYVMYGQTEASPRMSYLPPHYNRDYPECIGIPVPGGAFLLEDKEGNVIKEPDVEGELIYTGPNVMMGYAYCDQDLYHFQCCNRLRTGDIACVNKEGLYYLVGRKSRFIKPFGLRISLETVEEFLFGLGIKAICSGHNEQLWILTVDNIDKVEIAEKIAEWLNVPARTINILTINAIPLNANGKIDYPRIKELISKECKKLQLHDVRKGSDLSGITDGKSNKSEYILCDIYSNAVGMRIEDSSLTLREVGADSLSLVHVRLELEKYITDIPDQWIDMPIRELSTLFKKKNKNFLSLFSLKNIEIFIVFRALAIFFIVAHHFEWFSLPGGTTTPLFIISGYLYFETNREVILSNGRPFILWRGLLVLISTLIPITLAMAISHSYFKSDWHITLLLPFENLRCYISDMLDISDNAHHVVWLWFIHVYIQVFSLIALTLSFRKVRDYLSRNPYTKLLICFIALEIVGATIISVDAMRKDLGHSAALLSGAPTSITPIIIYGALLVFTNTPKQVLITSLAGFSYMIFYFAGIFTQGGIAALVAVAYFLYSRTFKMPSLMIRPIIMMSEASLFIYLTHMPFRYGVNEVFNLGIPPMPLTIIAILIAILLWPIWRNIVVTRIRKLGLS